MDNLRAIKIELLKCGQFKMTEVQRPVKRGKGEKPASAVLTKSLFDETNRAKLTKKVSEIFEEYQELFVAPTTVDMKEDSLTSWSIRCPYCQAFRKVQLNIEGGIRFYTQNFKSHLDTHRDKHRTDINKAAQNHKISEFFVTGVNDDEVSDHIHNIFISIDKNSFYCRIKKNMTLKKMKLVNLQQLINR